MPRPALLALTILCGYCAMPCAAEDAPRPVSAVAIDEEKVKALVADLGAEDFEKRESAERALRKLCPNIKLWKLLSVVLEKEKDQEVVSRLRGILPIAELGYSPYWPEELTSLDVTDMKLKDVLDWLSGESKKNIRTKRRKLAELQVTVKIENMPCRNILYFVARKYGLAIDEGLIKHDVVIVESAEKVSLIFIRAGAQDVFDTIAVQGNLNIILGPEVNGPVTVEMEDVPAEDALATVAKTLDFAAVREKGNVWRVNSPHIAPPEDKTARANFPATQEAKISLEVIERPLGAVLDYLSGMSKLKITAQGLEKTIVSFKLDNVTCRAILEHLGDTYGLNIDDSTAGTITLDRPPLVSLRFRNADANEILNNIRDQSGAKITVDAEVKGTLSTRLENVVWRDALSAVAKSVGCVAERDADGTWHVRKPKN